MTVILTRVKYPYNLAAAIRAAACFGGDAVLWTGGRFHFADGERLPREERMKGYRHVTVEETERPFDRLRGLVTPVCVEITPASMPLTEFVHPDRAAYVFGPEDGHVPQSFRGLCHSFVHIPAHHCLNLAAAINVVLFHRLMQRQQMGLEGPVSPAVTEERGLIEVGGWEGR